MLFLRYVRTLCAAICPPVVVTSERVQVGEKLAGKYVPLAGLFQAAQFTVLLL